MRTLRISVLSSFCLVAATLFSSGCATVADDYRIADGSEQDRGYTSVAGNVEVGKSARIGKAKTVSGNIEIGEQSRTGSLSSVAGRIRVGANSQVGGSIKTVAGDIEIARGCTITGDVGTVAGRVAVTDSVVKGDVTMNSGKLDLMRSRIGGALRIERTDDEDADAAEVNVGADSEVGKVTVEKGGRVHLRVHRSAKVGPITGAVAEYYD
jgi:hypothetical protein